jgi:hypothetical protein
MGLPSPLHILTVYSPHPHRMFTSKSPYGSEDLRRFVIPTPARINLSVYRSEAYVGYPTPKRVPVVAAAQLPNRRDTLRVCDHTFEAI